MSNRLLIVDDDRFLQENLRKLLARQGYEVDGASSGEEALRLVVENRYDLVRIATTW